MESAWRSDGEAYRESPTLNLKFELFDDRVRVAPRFRLRSGTDIYLGSITGIELDTGGFWGSKGHIRFFFSGGGSDECRFDRMHAGDIARFKKAVEQQLLTRGRGVGRQVTASHPNTGVVDELGRLADLWERGAITDDEYAEAKQLVLEGT